MQQCYGSQYKTDVYCFVEHDTTTKVVVDEGEIDSHVFYLFNTRKLAFDTLTCISSAFCPRALAPNLD